MTKNLMDIYQYDLKEMQNWLYNLLSGLNSFPFRQYDQFSDIFPYVYAERIYRTSKDRRFHNTFETALLRIFEKYTRFNLDAEIVTILVVNIIFLIAKLNLIECKTSIKKLLLKGLFVNKPDEPKLMAFVPGIDMHYHLLKLYLEFVPSGDDFDDIEVLSKNIAKNNYRYAHLCYKGLWLCNKKNGLLFLPEFHYICDSSNNLIDFNFEFTEYFSRHTLFCLKYFDAYTKGGYSLPQDTLIYLSKYLANNRIYLAMRKSNEREVYIRSPYGEKRSINEEAEDLFPSSLMYDIIFIVGAIKDDEHNSIWIDNYDD